MTYTHDTNRTDIHRPAELVPENYREVGWYDLGTSTERPSIHLSHEVSADDRLWVGVHGDQLHRCDHCGARLRYGAELVHIPTGGHIHVGETCLGNRFNRSSSEFHALRKAAQLDRERQRLLTAWNEYKAANPVDWEALSASENGFIKDVLRKGRQYGYLTDNQLAAIVKAYDRDVEYAAKKANEAVIPRVPAPEGKTTITGKIVSIKEKDSDWGTVLKCTVVCSTDDGEFVVWGSLARALEGEWGCTECKSTTSNVVHKDSCTQSAGFDYIGQAKVGDTVTFSATFTRSNDDESFAFYKRPTKASIVAAS